MPFNRCAVYLVLAIEYGGKISTENPDPKASFFFFFFFFAADLVSLEVVGGGYVDAAAIVLQQEDHVERERDRVPRRPLVRDLICNTRASQARDR